MDWFFWAIVGTALFALTALLYCSFYLRPPAEPTWATLIEALLKV